MKSFSILVLFIAILMSGPLHLETATTSRTEGNVQKIPPELGEIVTAREQLRGFVLDIKERFESSDKEYKQARRFYRNASSEYMGWTRQVEFAIEQGTAKDLRKDELYSQKSEKAAKASKEFLDYVQSVTAQSKSILPFISAIADIGIKIWIVRRDMKSKERKASAASFAEKVKWERWEDINVTPQKPAEPNL
jgi:hypothetical protein